MIPSELFKLAGITMKGVRFTSSPSTFTQNLMKRLPYAPDIAKNVLDESVRAVKDPTTAGRAVPGLGTAWIRPKSNNIMPMRDTIAHEAFHVNNPALGNSEILARAYGGWRAPRGPGPGRAGASLLDRAQSMKNNVTNFYGSPEVMAHYGSRGLMSDMAKIPGYAIHGIKARFMRRFLSNFGK